MMNTSHPVDDAIRSRRAVRAFLATPVPRAVVEQLLEVASCAPSNSNTQPWQVHVLEGEPKRELSARLLDSHERNELPHSRHFPDELPPAFQPRQTDFGQRYYRSLGIDRSDSDARYRQTGRNYLFFDAPIGLIFTIDRRLAAHSWLDYGLFLQTLMIAARARGLDTCPQVSFVRHEPVLREFLELPPEQTVVCGMSLGHADPASPLNSLAMPREAIDGFTTFRGFEGD